MKINVDINVLGSIADYNLIINYMNAVKQQKNGGGAFQSYSNIKTTQSFKRYERAINSTLLKFKNPDLEALVDSVLENEGISANSLLLLLWNASGNNDFLHYLNNKVLFPAFFSGRIGFKKDEVIACIKELRQKETALQKWTDSTIDVTARKYINFLVKVGLMEGGRDKTFLHRYIDDRLFVIFVYWLLTVETRSNILSSQWLQYSLMEKESLVERIIQKTFREYFMFQYSGDNLKIEPLLKYKELYAKLA